MNNKIKKENFKSLLHLIKMELKENDGDLFYGEESKLYNDCLTVYIVGLISKRQWNCVRKIFHELNPQKGDWVFDKFMKGELNERHHN
jgi:hypothetical protein